MWTPDGRRCLTGTQAGEFTMWGGTAFQFETIIQSHETPVRTMVFTHNGNFLLSGDDAGNVSVWVGTDGRGHQQAPSSLALSTPTCLPSLLDWQAAVCGAKWGWDLQTALHMSMQLQPTALSPPQVRYWKPNLELVKSVGAHREAVRQLAAAPSDLKYATASDDSTVRVWDFARVATEAVLAGHGGDVKCVDWHPHKALLASGAECGVCVGGAGAGDGGRGGDDGVEAGVCQCMVRCVCVV